MKIYGGGVEQESPQPRLGYLSNQYIGLLAVSTSVLTPSEGHWVWAEEGWTLRVEGEANRANPTVTQLASGWNLVGNPFETPLDLNMIFTGWEAGKPLQPFTGKWYVWENGDYYEAASLGPWRGAWVLAAQETRLAFFDRVLFEPQQHTRALITWPPSSNPGVVGYNIYRDGVRVNDALVVQTSYMLGNLEVGKEHVIQVMAVDNALQESPFTDELVSTTYPINGEGTGVIGGRLMKLKTPNLIAFSSSMVLESVASASISLSGTGKTVVTDAWGYFEFNQVPPGVYSMVAEDSLLGIGRGTVAVAAQRSVDAGEIVYHPPVRLATGRDHACAVKKNGQVRCWGLNGFGQLGNGVPLGENGFALNELGEEDSSYFLPNPVNVLFGDKIISIATGFSHTCALLENGKVYCWGSNEFGQLGNNSFFNSSIPVPVEGISNAVSIGVGDLHSCAIVADGTARCWGANFVGQLGDGTKISKNTPQRVESLENVISIDAGTSHTCALISNGEVFCFGRVLNGRLGDGNLGSTSEESQNIPTRVLGINNAIQISVGDAHACVVGSDGLVQCWGWNVSGQLGDGSLEDRALFVNVSNLSNGMAVSSGNQHTCAVRDNKKMYCWGRNEYGQIGNGVPLQHTIKEYVEVLNIDSVEFVAGGGLFTCAMRSDDVIFCWGYNEYGNLGIGNTQEQSIPVQVNW